jgi:hypothetical protein
VCAGLYFAPTLLYETQHAKLEKLRSSWVRRLWGRSHVYHCFWSGTQDDRRDRDEQEVWVNGEEKEDLMIHGNGHCIGVVY